MIETNELDEDKLENEVGDRNSFRTNILDKVREKYQGKVVSRKSLTSEDDLEAAANSLSIDAIGSGEDSDVSLGEESGENNETDEYVTMNRL